MQKEDLVLEAQGAGIKPGEGENHQKPYMTGTPESGIHEEYVMPWLTCMVVTSMVGAIISDSVELKYLLAIGTAP